MWVTAMFKNPSAFKYLYDSQFHNLGGVHVVDSRAKEDDVSLCHVAFFHVLHP